MNKNDVDQLRFSTNHELKFIESLGRNKFGSLNLMLDREATLKRYVKAAAKRENWAGIDKDIVLSTAKKLLREV